MADIAMRFDRDMLVLTAPIDAALARQGVDVARDREFMNLVEPDTVADAYRIQMAVSVPCLVTNTAGMTPARLAHHGMEDRAGELAVAAVTVAQALKPQHIIVEIGPCGLPLDPSLKSSLNEHRDQYARTARAFLGLGFDAFYLSGSSNLTELKCALMGMRQVGEAPIFASVLVDELGIMPDGSTAIEAAAVMTEYEAQVIGIVTPADAQAAAAVATDMKAAFDVPVLVELHVTEHAPKQGAATAQNPYFSPDTMVAAGQTLRAAGVQFLRASGDCTPAYTGVLAATMYGLDVIRPVGLQEDDIDG